MCVCVETEGEREREREIKQEGEGAWERERGREREEGSLQWRKVQLRFCLHLAGSCTIPSSHHQPSHFCVCDLTSMETIRVSRLTVLSVTSLKKKLHSNFEIIRQGCKFSPQLCCLGERLEKRLRLMCVRSRHSLRTHPALGCCWASPLSNAHCKQSAFGVTSPFSFALSISQNPLSYSLCVRGSFHLIVSPLESLLA